MSKKGGLPRDTLFRTTEIQEGPAREAENVVVETEKTIMEGTEAVMESVITEEKPKSWERQVNISQSKHDDSETSCVIDAVAAEKQKTTNVPRQTYYVPAEMHKQLRLLALNQGKNVSDLVVKGIEWILEKYDK